MPRLFLVRTIQTFESSELHLNEFINVWAVILRIVEHYLDTQLIIICRI